MKKTSLYSQHTQLGAKMVPFAGYEMPVQYTSVIEEHMAVRQKVGMFDVSHMGEFVIKGENATALIQYIFSNDISKAKNMQAQYGYMPNEEGGIVDDLIIYKWDENEYNLVVNASNIEKDWNWISKHNEKFGAEMENISDDLSLIAVQGPEATALIQKLTEVNLSEIPFYHFGAGKIGDIEDIVISNTGYTGSGGFELYVWNKDASKLWELLLKNGVAPCGLAARDTLRLEKGYCLYGNDINDTTSPIEAGLSWVTKFTKDFVAKDILETQKANGVPKKLVAFAMIERGIPRKDYTLVDKNGTEIGTVTSGTQSPLLKKGIGLGYVSKEHSAVDSTIYLKVRNKQVKAEVVKLPFV